MKNGTIYEFDGFQLVPGEELLLRNGELVPLNIKSLNVLKLLVENHGHLVTKAEIIDTVWRDTFVEEGSIAKAIWSIRHALEDTSRERYIQTVPRRGYRFVSPVSVITGSSGAFRLSELGGQAVSDTGQASYEEEQATNSDPFIAAAGIVESDTRQPYEKSVPKWAIVVGLVLIVVGAAALYMASGKQDLLRKGKPSRVVVLPFRPLDRQASDTIYDLGIAEALISKLRADKDLSVLPLDTVLQSSEGNDDPVKIGEQRKADYVLSSHYQLANERIKVTVKLIDVATGTIEEEFSATTQSTDPFAVHEFIANDIGNRILARFGSVSSEFRNDWGTNNENAYRYFLMAHNFNELRGLENGSIALEQIERALELDPNFARGWAAKAFIHRYMAYGAEAHEQSLKSMEAVDKALALDPNLSEAHGVLCFNKFRFEYDFGGAEHACRRAIELDPNSPLARKLYSNFLYTRGRFDEAIAEIKKAIDLQPVSYDNQQTYGLALYFARDFAGAEAQWKQLIPLNPNHRLIFGQLVRALVPQGKEAEALENLVKMLQIEKADEATIESFRAAFAKSGWQGVTLERIRIAESQPNPPSFELARFYATVGDKDNAFKYLEKAFQEKSNMMAVVGVDPELDPLRNDPRFVELLQKVEGKN